jgi:hypothetical protein
MERLLYKDYRLIKKGDKGWTPEKQKARQMYSPSTGNIITRRNFQEQATKVSEIQYKKKMGIKEIKAKVEKERKQKEARKRSKQKGKVRKIKEKLEKRKEHQIISGGERATIYRERVLFLQKSYAQKVEQETGYEIDFDSLSDAQRTEFWQVYHQLMDEGRPSKDRIKYYYDDFFDTSYEEYEDLEYGPTP